MSPVGLPLFTRCLSFQHTGLEKHVLRAQRPLESVTSDFHCGETAGDTPALQEGAVLGQPLPLNRSQHFFH